MAEKETPESQEQGESAGGLWCPGCAEVVPLGGLHVSFNPQTAQLSLDGTLDWGNLGDVFMDYDHLECGTHVRVVSNAGWQEEIGEYVADVRNAFLEVTIRGEYQTPHDDDSEFMGIAAFSGSVAGDTATWGKTFDDLLGLYESAVKAHDGKAGDA
jgi:hypothetical protein